MGQGSKTPYFKGYLEDVGTRDGDIAQRKEISLGYQLEIWRYHGNKMGFYSWGFNDLARVS